MGTEGSGASRAGGDGFHNEDAFLVEEGLGLYVVCDGASRTPAGELAAKRAAEALEVFFERSGSELDPGAGRAPSAVVDEAMAHAIACVADAARQDPRLEGLTTTITMLLAHGHRGVIGHRGDSRAYLIRRDRAHQLTRDHELSADAGYGGESPDYDVFAVDLEPDDMIVLCTDGAEEFVRDPAIVRAAGDLSPRVLASRIVSAANRRHPESDATAVVVRVRGDFEPGWLELSAPSRGTAFGHTIAPIRRSP